MNRWIRRFMIARAIRRILRDGFRQRIREERASPPHLFTVEDAQAIWSHHMSASLNLGGLITGKPVDAHLSPGRQAIRMPYTASVFGQGGWAGLIPDHAREAPWEDCHTFVKGDRPKREPWGMVGGPPIALVCVGCELAQPPMQSTERDCPYCGLHYRLHGTRLFWWRKNTAEVPEWKP